MPLKWSSLRSLIPSFRKESKSKPDPVAEARAVLLRVREETLDIKAEEIAVFLRSLSDLSPQYTQESIRAARLLINAGSEAALAARHGFLASKNADGEFEGKCYLPALVEYCILYIHHNTGFEFLAGSLDGEYREESSREELLEAQETLIRMLEQKTVANYLRDRIPDVNQLIEQNPALLQVLKSDLNIMRAIFAERAGHHAEAVLLYRSSPEPFRTFSAESLRGIAVPSHE